MQSIDDPKDGGAGGLVAVDLFCGCGGLSHGMELAGVSVALGIDKEETILETYRGNFSHPGVQLDLQNWEAAVECIGTQVPGCNVVVGSPPCTEFSRAGKQVEGSVASLTICFARIVSKVQPLFFVMENVPDVFHSRSFEEALRVLFGAGYSVASIVKDAQYCGVPQKRRRFFMVGTKASCKNEGVLEAVVHQAAADARSKGRVVGVREYCAGQGTPCPDFLFFCARNHFQAQVVSTEHPYPTLRSSNGVCMQQKSARKVYVRRPNDAADVSEAQSMTVALAAAISSFPPEFKWPADRRKAGIQLGNCVPPLLAKYVGELFLGAVRAAGPLDREAQKQGEYVCKPVRKSTKKVHNIDKFLASARGLGGDPASPLVRVHVNPADVAGGTRELFYELGGHSALDRAAVLTRGFHLEPGWTLHIKERVNKNCRIDDMFVLVPGYAVPFRGRRLLVKNGLAAEA